MEGHIAGGETFGLECVVQRVAGNGAAVNGQENVLSVCGLPEAHEVSQPALNSAALVVIAPGTLFVILIPALEAIDIELPHVVPNPVKVFDKLTVCYTAPPPL